MLIFFTVSCILFIIIDYRLNRKAINVVSLFTAPYLFLVIGNHLIGEKIGFFPISDDVLLMLLGGLAAIFLGSVIISLKHKNTSRYLSFDSNKSLEYLSSYKIDKIAFYILIADLLMLIRFLQLYTSRGINAIIASTEIELIGGILGHIFLSAFPLVPILFLYWLYNKRDWKRLIPVIMYIAILAGSFVKYHVISMIVLIYIFVSFEDKRYVKKGVILLIGLVIVLFVSNYVIDFYFTNRLSTMNKNFYGLHLWKYIAGSVIHDNQIFTSGINPGEGVGIKVLYCISALPNMFYYGLTGNAFKWPFHINMDPVSYNGESSNVVDFIGWLYPSHGKFISIIAFFFVLFLLGLIFQSIYDNALKHKRGFLMYLYIMMTFFMFLSFFGNYYGLSVPWEILVWSLITPNLFNDKARIKFRIGSHYI